MIKTYFAIGGVEREHELNNGENLPMIWADGMIGVMPVFKSKIAAEKYADGVFGILEIKVEVREEKDRGNRKAEKDDSSDVPRSIRPKDS